MSFLLMQIALAFVPGVFWVKIDLNYSHAKRPSDGEIVAKIFFFGLLSYLAVYGLYSVIGRSFDVIDMAKAGDKYVILPGNLDEIGMASVVGVVGGCLWVTVRNRRWIDRAFIRAGITRRSGDTDLWERSFNGLKGDKACVRIRDFGNNQILQGFVSNYSETGGTRELLLVKVDVYNMATGEFAYTAPMMLVSRPSDQVMIEFEEQETNAYEADHRKPTGQTRRHGSTRDPRKAAPATSAVTAKAEMKQSKPKKRSANG
ncbi:hypothetical protein D3C71_481000 [compost metagenome]